MKTTVMKKKTIYLIGVVILLLICIITYFKPLSFSNTVSEDNQLQMILHNFEIRNGEAHNESVKYTDITTEQKSNILTLLEKFNYRRTFKTLFSDGYISDIGDEMLSIYVYDADLLVNSVIVTSSGKITINQKNYSMKNAEQLIAKIIEIVEHP